MKKQIVIFLLLITSLLSFQLKAQEDFQILTAVDIRGNSNIAKEEILGLVESKVGELFNPEILKEDMERIYQTGYFSDIQLSPQNYNGGLKAVFIVEEYPILRNITIKGNSIYSEDILKSLINLDLGQVLNYNKLKESRNKILEKYHDDGYILAIYSDIIINDEGVLLLQLDEGLINQVIIKGNDKTQDFVIRRELEFLPGEVFNKNKVELSVYNLVGLNYFKDIVPGLERVGQSNNTNVVIEVIEDKTRQWVGGTSYSSKDGWIGYTGVDFNNFMGKGQKIKFNWEFGGITNYSFDFYEPWLCGNETSFGISLFDKTSDGIDSNKGDFLEKRRGGSISFGYKLPGKWKTNLKYKIVDFDIEWVDDRENNKPEIYKIEKDRIHSLTLQFSKNTINHPINPTAGGRDIFSIEYAGQALGGTTNFTKYRTDFIRFYPGLKNGQTWNMRLQMGTSDGDLPELEKYRLGGTNSLRGYDYGIFSGKDMLLFKIEYSINLITDINGILFVDTGNAWDIGEDILLEDLHYSYGVGLRYNSPIGQIKLDYAFNEDGEGKTHFGIGTSF